MQNATKDVLRGAVLAINSYLKRDRVLSEMPWFIKALAAKPEHVSPVFENHIHVLVHHA